MNNLKHLLLMILLGLFLSANAQSVTLNNIEEEAATIEINRNGNSRDGEIIFRVSGAPTKDTEDWMLGIDGDKDDDFRLYNREFTVNPFPSPIPFTITDTEVFSATTNTFNFQSDRINMGTPVVSAKLSVRPNSTTLYALAVYNSAGNPKLIINQQGKVGINRITATHDLHIDLTGDAAAETCGIKMEQLGSDNYWTTYVTGSENYGFGYNGTNMAFIRATDGSYSPPSDRRLKTDIEPIKDVLEKVLKLQPAKYYYKENKARATTKTIGFIAQEVEPLFPEIVSKNEGYLALAYDHFAVLSVAAIQELHQIIEKQDKTNQQLQQQNTALENRLERLESLFLSNETGKTVSPKNQLPNDNATDLAALQQNRPNPYGDATIIDLYLPQNVQSAQLQISTTDGKILQSIAIKERGQLAQTIDSKHWQSGTYTYSLFADGKLIATKTMVLAK